ncbi:hypothetical protein L2E82_33031 [Cichorium intybus]|uniref:Uncharacterized protein n=1 Tax=Cichorium intybus TaxID=13427 RepID=A0ACB9BHJ0_CICIN|nr:hypothetical protein L2E82_33031 [Cichorium intybus]
MTSITPAPQHRPTSPSLHTIDVVAKHHNAFNNPKSKPLNSTKLSPIPNFCLGSGFQNTPLSLSLIQSFSITSVTLLPYEITNSPNRTINSHASFQASFDSPFQPFIQSKGDLEKVSELTNQNDYNVTVAMNPSKIVAFIDNRYLSDLSTSTSSIQARIAICRIQRQLQFTLQSVRIFKITQKNANPN